MYAVGQVAGPVTKRRAASGTAGGRGPRRAVLPMVAMAGLALAAGAAGTPVGAEEVAITPGVAGVEIVLNGQPLTIARNQDPEAVLSGEFARTSRACPPFCIQPLKALRNVETIGELEVLDFLKAEVAAGTGVLIDARMPEWFAKGSIPGAVNVPFATLSPDNPYRNDILAALGGKPVGGGNFDFTGAVSLVLFCNGPWSEQSAEAVRQLRAAGYPAEKIKYYRGGMQDWQILGLTVTAPQASEGGQP